MHRTEPGTLDALQRWERSQQTIYMVGSPNGVLLKRDRDAREMVDYDQTLAQYLTSIVLVLDLGAHDSKEDRRIRIQHIQTRVRSIRSWVD